MADGEAVGLVGAAEDLEGRLVLGHGRRRVAATGRRRCRVVLVAVPKHDDDGDRVSDWLCV
jgi:hypothetical protein